MKKRLPWIALGVIVLAGVVFLVSRPKSGGDDRFLRVMTAGQAYLERGEATNAISAYSEAVRLAPESVDARLNLANAHLLAGNSQAVVEECRKVVTLDHNSAAAYYLMGCAYLRMNDAEKAVQSFQESQKIDPAVTPLNFQLGLAHERLGQIEDAIREFETVVQFEPDHPSAHYQLSRLYQRTDRADDAARELARHEDLRAKNPSPPGGPIAFERSKHTQPRVAFALEQPAAAGVTVRYVEATADAFGPLAPALRGPIGVLDYNHDGRNSLFAMDAGGFRLLDNVKGRFSPLGEAVPGTNGAVYRRCLVGDLNADRFEDVIVLGEQASHAFRFATNGQFREVTAASGLRGLKAAEGVLADLDFTGRLDLLTALPGGQGLQVSRNLGNFYFVDNTTNSGLPSVLQGIEQVSVEDVNNDDIPGVLVTRKSQPPIFYAKQRAGAFVQTNTVSAWPATRIVAVGDLNNDLLLDFVLADDRALRIRFGGSQQTREQPLKLAQPKGLLLFDYDNDGWQDILAYGDGLEVWRNLGKNGFSDSAESLGLSNAGAADDVAAADFDGDGDTDLISSSPGGLRLWRNDGGNANKQLKLRLVGNRSNPSALGVKLEFVAGNWRTIRSVTELPFEVGVGKHERIEVLKTRWFDLATTLMDVTVEPKPISVEELVLPSGSCPYLYAWDGSRFRFVTDILGAAPLGLPVSEHRYVEADPEEYLELGNEQQFPPKEGKYELRITEELREVLYLDAARLVVVDHPPGTLVLPTSKMLPSRPFVPHELWTLRPRADLRQAVRGDGLDCTAQLSRKDREMVKPARVREPQLRGLAEPFAVTMDFGPLPADEPLVLVLNGWLRFGGGMANIAGSIDPTLPFPFPTLEAELADGSWKKLPVRVGVPAGKTKTILVDLERQLPAGAGRLRLSTAFELYWDYAAICAKVAADRNRRHDLSPVKADLRWYGFSEFAALPEWLPLTPIYGRAQPLPPWRRTPFGWCTRYGSVMELVAEKDNALALLNGGDEVALSFDATRLPPRPAGYERDFFLYAVGWDKDADFHVGQGWRVEPLPFHGMADQAYDSQSWPESLNNAWIGKYNTRWVGPMVLQQARVKPAGTRR